MGRRDHQQDSDALHLPARHDQLGAQLWPRLRDRLRRLPPLLSLLLLYRILPNCPRVVDPRPAFLSPHLGEQELSKKFRVVNNDYQVGDEIRRYFIRLALRQETWLGDFLTMETYY